jgi:hypothetical protein
MKAVLGLDALQGCVTLTLTACRAGCPCSAELSGQPVNATISPSLQAQQASLLCKQT